MCARSEGAALSNELMSMSVLPVGSFVLSSSLWSFQGRGTCLVPHTTAGFTAQWMHDFAAKSSSTVGLLQRSCSPKYTFWKCKYYQVSDIVFTVHSWRGAEQGSNSPLFTLTVSLKSGLLDMFMQVWKCINLDKKEKLLSLYLKMYKESALALQGHIIHVLSCSFDWKMCLLFLKNMEILLLMDLPRAAVWNLKPTYLTCVLALFYQALWYILWVKKGYFFKSQRLTARDRELCQQEIEMAFQDSFGSTNWN